MKKNLRLLYKDYVNIKHEDRIEQAIAMTVWKADNFILIDESEDNKIYRCNTIKIGKVENKEPYEQYVDKKYHTLDFYKVLDNGISKINEDDEMIIEPILEGEERIIKDLRIYEEVDFTNEPTNPVELFYEVKGFIEKYIEFSDDNDAYKVTAFIFHAYLYHNFPSTVYLHITGPKGSGKSKLAEILSKLLPRPIRSSSMSTAAAVHYIENYNAILILDEQDTIKNGSDDSVKNDYLNILNAGYRKGDSYQRLGEDNKPRVYNVFSPKIIVGRYNLPDTLESRCLVIKMVRSSKPMPYQIDDDEAAILRVKLRTYAIEYRDKIVVKDIPLPDGRVRDLFVPLINVIPNEIVKKYFKDIILNELEDRQELERYSKDAELVNILLKFKGKEISASDIINELYPDDEDRKRNTTRIGIKLGRFGFKKVKKSDKNYYLINDKILERLKNSYGFYNINKDFDLEGYGTSGTYGTLDRDEDISNKHKDAENLSVNNTRDTLPNVPEVPEVPSKEIIHIDNSNLIGEHAFEDCIITIKEIINGRTPYGRCSKCNGVITPTLEKLSYDALEKWYKEHAKLFHKHNRKRFNNDIL